MHFPFTSSRPLLGMDVQSDKIRLVQLKRQRSHYVIERIAEKLLPADVFLEGKLRQTEIFSQHLAAFVKQQGLRGKGVAIALPYSLVRLQYLVIPKGMSVIDIQALLRAKITRELPGITESMFMDFAIIGEIDSRYDHLVFVIAREESVVQYVRAVNTAGLIVKRVEVDAFAIQRVFDACLPKEWVSNCRAMIYEINHFMMLLVFHAKQLLYFQYWRANEGEHFYQTVNRHLALAMALSSQTPLTCLAIGSEHYRLSANQLECIKHDQFEIVLLTLEKIFSYSRALRLMENNEALLPSVLASGLAMGEDVQW